MVYLSFSDEELYEMWYGCFRDNENAVQIMADFMGDSDNKKQAAEKIAEFELRAACNQLDSTHRGKE